MRVTIQLPDDISAVLEEQWDDVPRRSLEAIAVDAYRTGALTESQVRRLLELESRSQCSASQSKGYHSATPRSRSCPSTWRCRRQSMTWSAFCAAVRRSHDPALPPD